MKTRMKKDKWEKTVIIDNREFRITFWYDSWNLFYTRIEEKIEKRPTLFNRKNYVYNPICSDYWIDETETNPIELAMKKISDGLKTEKELTELEKLLDEFCQ